MIKHLIFDFDGVIVDSEILAAKAFSQVLSNMKIESKYTTEFIAEKFAGNKMIKVAGEICKMHNIKDANSYLNNVMKLVSDLYSKNLKSVNGIDDFLDWISGFIRLRLTRVFFYLRSRDIQCFSPRVSFGFSENPIPT